VDCISPAPESREFDDAEQLYINPETCIDCAACVDACPVNAIYKRELLPQQWLHYAEVNRVYFAEKKGAMREESES
jgi:ferredoxin--NADP+ reductase